MKLIAVTGGIGSGKTIISKIFNCIGIPVYFSDSEAKRLMCSNSEIREKLQKEFGNNVYVNGQLQKNILAQIIFNNSESRKIVNQIVHPVVRKDFIEWTQNQNSDYCIMESALVFDSDLYSLFDAVVYVDSPIEIRIQRVMNRDNCSREDVLQRIKMQPSDEICLQKSHFVVENNNTFVIPQVLKIHQRILTL